MAGVSIEGQVVAITGVTSGVGRAAAVEFAQRGALVVGLGRREQAGAELAAEIGDGFTFVAGDVKRVADCERLIRTAVEVHGRLDVLINNAGTPGDPVIVDSHEAEEQWWDDILDTNLKGAFFCSRYALGRMVQQRSGLILNISSTNAVGPLARMQAYNASKAALVALSAGLAVEYADSGIRVNSIVLGAVADGDAGRRTQQAIVKYLTGAEPPERKASATRRSAREVAAFLATLCEPDAALVTGATIAVDGGVSAGLLGNKYWLSSSARSARQ
jgi:NAD(P)-dependent dehydrogenase (short-subunit alcohol dehydrogenase family)